MAGFCLAELLARLFLPPPPHVTTAGNGDFEQGTEGERTRHEALRLPRHPSHGSLFVNTPTGLRLRANRLCTIENHTVSRRRTEIRTNALGYRNPDLGEKTGKRILFLGDSITFAGFSLSVSSKICERDGVASVEIASVRFPSKA